MKINMRTITQAFKVGERLYREWNKFQKQASSQPGSPSSTQSGRSRTAPQTPRSRQPQSVPSIGAGQDGSWQDGGYPGDYRGQVNFEYSPALDGDADPGEVVWAWVPFEEDYTQGKDRPLLIIGRSGPYLLGLMLTSKDHSTTRSSHPAYLDIGPGVWDKEGRDSEVKLDRVIRLNPRGLRREGAIMDRATFDFIAKAYHRR